GGVDRPTTYEDSHTLITTIPASEFTTMGTIPVSVFTPGPGGGVSNIISFVIYRAMTLATKDLVHDRGRDRIYASVPENAPNAPNTLVAIDPSTGSVASPIFVGTDPGKLTISNDSRVIYMLLNRGAQVRRFDTDSQTLGPSFGLGSNQATLGNYY